MCLQESYRDLLSWHVGAYMIWYMMLFVSLCQVRYFQVESILFSIFQGVQSSGHRPIGGYLTYVGYIKEPRWILGLPYNPDYKYHRIIGPKVLNPLTFVFFRCFAHGEIIENHTISFSFMPATCLYVWLLISPAWLLSYAY